MDREDCYVFAPLAEGPYSPRKRRKKAHAATNHVWNIPFPALMKGMESKESVRYRYELFGNVWQPQEEALQDMLKSANYKTIESVRSFVISMSERGQQSNLPTGLILQDIQHSGLSVLNDVLCQELNELEHTICVSLTSGLSPNLKTILRYVNLATTTSVDVYDETRTGRSHKLDYDLQLLHDHVKQESLKNIVLLFEESEAFEGCLLSDLIDLLNHWSDRIPFLLLFEIATSVDIFQSKLSTSAISCLEGRQFNAEQIKIEDMFKKAQSGVPRLFLGPGLSRLIIEGQHNFIKTGQAFIQTLKYAYMTHFFSNPFSVWLDPQRMPPLSDQECVKSARHLPSFRRFLQQYIDAHQHKTARKLLEDDVQLRKSIILAAEHNLQTLRDIVSAIDTLFALTEALHAHTGSPCTSWSELYILAMSDKLSESDLLGNTLVTLRRLRSDILQECLKSIEQEKWANNDYPDLQIGDTVADLAELTARISRDGPLQSAHDIQFSNVRTTIVAQKVELRRQSAEVTEDEAYYTKIVEKFVSKIELFLGSRLIHPLESFLHEVFVYDIKTTYREVFMPRPRFAIERGLNSPHDYLSCTCCNGPANGLSALQPPTAIVYQLYLESGNVINTADLWSAFSTILGSEDMEKALALFSRALGEMKYLGLIKNSRKRVDHLAKLLWKGL